MNKLILALSTVATLMTTQAHAQHVIRRELSPTDLILQSVKVTPAATMVFVSGQVASPQSPEKYEVGSKTSVAAFGDTKDQTISALNKIKIILSKDGMTMADVVKLTIFAAGDPKLGRIDIAAINAGFREFFGTNENPSTVARSTVQVAALVAPEYLVEIEAIAAK
ncbi:Rid family hydrolase [Sphingomonas sp. R86521]|uniref:Rid family hydrolase n=1 Tax=Sphingomonas sp. R86521 TaxID=3093860 RepID=UPI0036D39169